MNENFWLIRGVGCLDRSRYPAVFRWWELFLCCRNPPGRPAPAGFIRRRNRRMLWSAFVVDSIMARYVPGIVRFVSAHSNTSSLRRVVIGFQCITLSRTRQAQTWFEALIRCGFPLRDCKMCAACRHRIKIGISTHNGRLSPGCVTAPYVSV